MVCEIYGDGRVAFISQRRETLTSINHPTRSAGTPPVQEGSRELTFPYNNRRRRVTVLR